MHDTLVAIAKSWGLFYMIGFSVIVLLWVYRPSNRRRFERAARSILDAEDRPVDPSAEASGDPPADTAERRP